MRKDKFDLLFFKFLILSITVCLVSCSFDSPGDGKRAQLGYDICNPITQALEVFQKDSSYYPASIENLVPVYLENINPKAQKYRVTYDLPDTLKNKYALQFTYYGPGTNVCTYIPKGEWKCVGFY